MRALAVTTKERLATAPDIASMAETLSDFNLASWHALIDPKRLLQVVVERVNREIGRTLCTSEVAERMQAMVNAQRKRA